MEKAEPLDDATLFARIRGGDADAFADFYDRHSSLLFGVAMGIVGELHEAEDVLQDACVLLWERAPLHDPRLGKPLAWAVTLTRNKAIDRLRARRRKADLMAAAAAEVEAVGGGSEATPIPTDDEEAGAIRKALETLSASQREALQLGYFQGLTQQEIAERLGQPLGTVKARMRRGMIALRDAMEGRL
jgi:RNA polymerase sigma-70 factor (ECF subfamily)